MKICPNVVKLNQRLRASPGKKIVFTNGVFDILHPGHIQLFRFCKEKGDLLVVGINDDASVERLKGKKRPIFPLKERMEVLAAIEWVDYIVPFSQDTPLELIKSIAGIDALVKGGDYRPEEVVGRNEVEAGGGRLYIFPLSAEYSTTALIEKIRMNCE